MVRRDRVGRAVVPRRRADPSGDVRRCNTPTRRRLGTPRLERSFVGQLRGSPCSGTRGGLRPRHLGVMGPAQHFETADSMFVRVLMVMAPGSISVAIARGDVVDFAISSGSRAPGASAAILRPPFCRGAGEPPNVFSLPRAAALVGAPRAPSGRRDLRIAPLAPTGLAGPRRQRTADALGHEWGEGRCVNGAFRRRTFGRHFGSNNNAHVTQTRPP